MRNLKYYQEIIKEKRKQTNFRNYLKEIASFGPLTYYKNNSLTSVYPDKSILKNIISTKSMQEIRDTIESYNLDYSDNEDFWNIFKKLYIKVPFSNVIDYGGNENCDFAQSCYNSKNAYLSNTIIDGENIFYSVSIKETARNIFNSLVAWDNSENIYFCSGIIKSYNIFFSRYIYNSSNCWGSNNLVGCSECIACNNLENKSYCIANKQYSKEEYLEKKKEIMKNKNIFYEKYKKGEIKPINLNSKDVTGNMIFFSKDIQNGNFIYQVKSGRNCFFTGGAKDENMFDTFFSGSFECNDFYGAYNCGAYSNNMYISMHCGFCSNIYYSIDLLHCSFCIGCIGLRNKSYYIFNKQYSKKEWEILAGKILLQMENDGTLGDFFPGSLNPFYFNDSIAYLIDDSFTKEEVEKEGYMRRDEEIKVDIPENAEVVNTNPPQSPFAKGGSRSRAEAGGFLDDYQGFDENGKWYINPEILKKVIKDEKGNYYRIVKMEYDFLMKYELPLPEIHWLDRIKLGFKFK